MSALLDVILLVRHAQNGSVDGVGTLKGPLRQSGGGVASFETDGGSIFLRQGVVLAPGVDTLLWDYTDAPVKPELMYINPSASIFVSYLVDKPVSDTDLTPAGTHRQWIPAGAGCCRPKLETISEALTAPTGVALTQEAGGKPWAFANRVVGRVYGIRAYNPNADEATVDVALFP